MHIKYVEKCSCLLTSSGGEDGTKTLKTNSVPISGSKTPQFEHARVVYSNTKSHIKVHVINCCTLYIQGGARNVIPLIVHVTHFYYYKSI